MAGIDYENPLTALPEESFTTPNPSLLKQSMHRSMSRPMGNNDSEDEGPEGADQHGILSLISAHYKVPKHVWAAHRALYMDKECKVDMIPLIPNSKVMSGRWDHRSIFYLPLMPTYHWTSITWLLFMLMFDFTYTAFWVPLSVGFCTNNFVKNFANDCSKVNLAGGIVYAANLLIRFQIDGQISYDFQRFRIGNGVLLAWYYIRYGPFWIDLIATIPFLYLCLVAGSAVEHHDNQVWLAVVTLLRLVRLMPLASMSRIMYADRMSRQYRGEDDSKYRIKLSIPTMYVIILIYVLAVVINLQASIVLLIASFEGYEDSWMTTLDWADLVAESSVRQWYSAVYWIISTGSTTGYGDIIPMSYAEMVFVNIYMAMGMVMFGLLVGTVGNMLTKANETASMLHQYRKKISRVTGWMQQHQIIDETKREIQAYFSEIWAVRDESSLNAEIFNDLPQCLRQKLAMHVTLGLVKEMKLFQSGDPGKDADLQKLVAQRLRPVDILPGADICQQGEGSDRLWLIQEGDVLALQHLKPPITLRPPCLVGDSVLLAEDVPSCRNRIFTIRTLSLCKVWELRMSDFYPILRIYPSLREDMVRFVQAQVVNYLNDPSPKVEDMDIEGSVWCESAACAVRPLKDMPQETQAQARMEIQAANTADGSLHNLLEGLFDFARTRARATALQLQTHLAPAYSCLPTTNSNRAESSLSYGPRFTSSRHPGPLSTSALAESIGTKSLSNLRPASSSGGVQGEKREGKDALDSNSWPRRHSEEVEAAKLESTPSDNKPWPKAEAIDEATDHLQLPLPAVHQFNPEASAADNPSTEFPIPPAPPRGGPPLPPRVMGRSLLSRSGRDVASDGGSGHSA